MEQGSGQELPQHYQNYPLPSNKPSPPPTSGGSSQPLSESPALFPPPAFHSHAHHGHAHHGHAHRGHDHELHQPNPGAQF